MNKFFTVLLVLFLAFSTFAGCKKASKEGDAEFIIWNSTEPESLDPQLISGTPERRVWYSLFEGILTEDPKTAEGIPGIAESWEVSEDGTVYTFKLREASWSDGVPITAQTVVDSWLRMLNPETAAPYAWFPAMFLKGAGEYNAGNAGPEAVQIRALDEYTFQMELVGPFPYVIGALTHYAFSLVPIHAIEKHGKEWTNPENFVGNGPFVLKEWKPQERLTVVSNPLYWDKDSVKLKKITYIPVDDINTGYTMFLNGEVDLATQVPIDQLEAARLRKDYVVNPYLGTYYYTIQNEKPPFNDPRVRKALAMAFDRKELVEKVTKAGEVPAYTMVPPMTGYPGIEGNREDVKKAQQLLADAGYPDGKGFPKFELLYNTSENHKKIAEYIQQQWAENLGIECDLINQEWKTYLSTRRAGDFQVARAGWIGDYQDPNTFLDMFVTGAAMNGGRYSNSMFDELIGKAARMRPGEERFKALQQAEELFITEDQGVIPIYFYVRQNMIDLGKWGGWHPNIMDHHPMKYIYKKK